MNPEFLFPYEKIRRIQEDMIKEVADVVKKGGSMIAHAPTGLGKTIAALGPSLKHASENGTTVFFLTSRHTQHLIALETLGEIKKKYNLSFNAADIIGKRWMCAMEGIGLMSSRDFSEYCKTMRDDGKCEFYSRTRKGGKITPEAKKALSEIKAMNSCSTEKLVEVCASSRLCPYEMAMILAGMSEVIVADYYYMFNPSIRDNFLTKTGKEIEKSIVIIDEGHNLPSRLRELATEKLSSFVLKRAVKEAKKHNYNEVVEELSLIQDVLNSHARDLKTGSEKLVDRNSFIESINRIRDYGEIVSDLSCAGDDIREKQKQSYVGSVASFLESWKGSDKGFARILSASKFKDQPFVTLTYRCLDPSVLTEEIMNNSHSTIIMSGTLTPTSMYRDLLGFPENTVEKTYESPFLEDNRLTLVVPETTTKYSMRHDAQFRRIAEIVSDIVNLVPGNSAVFFPSYSLRDQVYRHLYGLCSKTSFREQPGMTKEEKTEFIENFKGYEKTGAVLLGASTGSFGEGIDLPGDFLKAVIIVGLPLEHPDLETKELIKYFDRKFNKGWDYGYIFPAFNRTLQNAGRCIRSEDDRGVIVFLDERYLWPMYKRCFPQDEDIKVSRHYKEMIEEFFEPKQRRLV